MNKCPICGSSMIQVKIVDEEFEYKSKTIVIPYYQFVECFDCEEQIPTKDTLEYADPILQRFKRDVDSIDKS